MFLRSNKELRGRSDPEEEEDEEDAGNKDPKGAVIGCGGGVLYGLLWCGGMSHGLLWCGVVERCCWFVVMWRGVVWSVVM